MFSEGLKGDFEDDRASYIYGKKELWYLESIETKNFVALFDTDNRRDGCGVQNKDGEIDQGANMRVLKKITLY